MNNLVEVQYDCNGSSMNTDALGMREMQQRVYRKADAQYLLIKAPPASGKSRALMFVGLEKLKKGSVSKAIVAVPERSIAKSFSSTDLTSHGFHSDWLVEQSNDLCATRGNTRKSLMFKRFLESDDKILLCSHATLRNAFGQIEADAFNNCLVAIDEFHHVSSDSESKLGELLRALMNGTDAHIVAMTGSYFRGDCAAVLSPTDESKFTKVTYNYYEQLNGCRYLKSLGIGFHFYQGQYLDKITHVLDVNKKTIVHIPHPNSSESTREKYYEVDSIIEKLGAIDSIDADGIIKVITKDGKLLKIADLVNDDPERENVIGYLRNVENEDDIDIIIALGMAKEGFDWPFCEAALTVGYRGSLTEIIQIIGRCTRDSPNKKHAQFTNLIAEPNAERSEIVQSVNDMLKAIAASLLMEEVVAPKFVFCEGDKISGGGTEIKIKGFKPPKSNRVKEIIENDLTDLKASIIQSPDIQNSFSGAVDPDIINRVLIPKVIRELYPALDHDELGELDDYVVTSLALNGSNLEKVGSDRFLRFSNKLINVNELNMDLVYSINPFMNSFDVMSKTLSPRVFKAIQQCIKAMHIRMTDDEAKEWWPKINDFVKATQRKPSLDSIDPKEKRMAEALIYLQQIKNETDR